METMDEKSARYMEIIQQSDIADRFPNWSSSANLSSFVRAYIAKEIQRQDEEEEFYRLEEVSAHFKLYYLWVIAALGLPGNVLSLLTFLSMRSLGSCVLYVVVLAVVDSLALVLKLVIQLLTQQGVAVTPHSCKTLFFLGNALMVYANWIVVALAVERLFAVCRPLALSAYWTPRMAAGVLGGVLLLAGLVCVPVIVVSEPTPDGRSCQPAAEYRVTTEVWKWANVTLYGFLPCVTLLAVNVAIISFLDKARRRQRSLCNGQTQSSASAPGRMKRGQPGRSSLQRQRQVSVLLVVAGFVLVLLTAPRCVLVIVLQFWRPTHVPVIARVRLLKQVTFALSDLNHAINFYLYFFSAGNFRRRLLELLRCRRTCGGPSLGSPGTTDTGHHHNSDDSVRIAMVSRKRSCSGGRHNGLRDLGEKNEYV